MSLREEVAKLVAEASPGPWYGDERYVVGMVAGGRPNGETIMHPYRSEMEIGEKIANARLACIGPLAEKIVVVAKALANPTVVEERDVLDAAALPRDRIDSEAAP